MLHQVACLTMSLLRLPGQVGWSVEGLKRVQRHAQELLPRLFPLQADSHSVAAPATLQPVSLPQQLLVVYRKITYPSLQRPALAMALP
jgi:hypothetical protein